MIDSCNTCRVQRQNTSTVKCEEPLILRRTFSQGLLHSQSAASLPECRAACAHDESCAAFSFLTDEQTCNLHSSIGDGPMAGRESCNPTYAGDMNNNVTCETCSDNENCCKLYHLSAFGDNSRVYNCFWDGQTCTNKNVGNNPCDNRDSTAISGICRLGLSEHVCATANEHQSVTLHCLTNYTISNVTFASYVRGSLLLSLEHLIVW
eukprot:COSAG01_NODE_2652_length_7308_cov_3.492995_6_plen_207_part_00